MGSLPRTKSPVNSKINDFSTDDRRDVALDVVSRRAAFRVADVHFGPEFMIDAVLRTVEPSAGLVRTAYIRAIQPQ